MEQMPKYWFNTKTGLVEQGYKSLAIDRIGPFETYEEASMALTIIAERARRIADEEAEQD